MSQDELAEKLGVSRQSISLWETGQTQPTIDNIIALAKIFNISSDVLLGNGDNAADSASDANAAGEITQKSPERRKMFVVIGVVFAAVIIIALAVFAMLENGIIFKKDDFESVISSSDTVQAENSNQNTASSNTVSASTNTNLSKVNSTAKPNNNTSASGNTADPAPQQSAATNTASDTEEQFDLFSYCKNFAIQKGTLNGDYSIYQQPSSKYGGYDNEYFSISYWGDSNMVEFCLHCPLDDTLSHNFYIRMRGGYNGNYEYLSSKYFRDTGESLRSATGYIDPAVFSDNYPISCDRYDGSTDGQDQFMEDSRVGICDLIRCLKNFVEVENTECDFSAFEFVNF